MGPEDSDLRAELLHRVEVDQQARNGWIALHGEPKDDPRREAARERVDEVDRDNTRWLREVVTAQGWPARSMVGDDGAIAAWLLVQHADRDLAFQRVCLDLMVALPESEAVPRNVAYLTDRVLLAEGESQVYGTQMQLVDGRYRPMSLRDPDTVDERRAAAGLDSLGEYMAGMQRRLDS